MAVAQNLSGPGPLTVQGLNGGGGKQWRCQGLWSMQIKFSNILQSTPCTDKSSICFLPCNTGKDKDILMIFSGKQLTKIKCD